MEPGIQTGSVIVVKPRGDMTRFHKGDVITFKMDEKTLVTHRITKVVKTGNGQVFYHTKGDNNNAEVPNPVLSDNVVAEYTGITIPYLGYFVNFAQSKNGSALMLMISGVVLLLYSIYTIRRAIAEIDGKKPKNSREPSGKNV